MEKSMTTEKVTAPEQTDAKTLCQKHMHRYVCVWVKDGTMYDGIVEHVDDEKIYLAVPMGGDEMENVNVNLPYPPNNCGCGSRAYGGYASYPPYPYPYPYPYPVPAYAHGFPYGRRRFNRLILPLAALTAISLLPYY
ncbi:hypothetical protein G9G54_13135 [Paenibacillus sp. EKM212P]|uniref:hypothetical protein n=1 Tax=Paenibacillus sp. EKM212P TaxID=1683680 RepID=UPI0013EC743F|nr:hypothetical protein [Paenibacillus sp. EKM212P]KAF6578219.1 hypothetical protein G9G54_13135 [Paenibacillus sp. EKM212P]